MDWEAKARALALELRTQAVVLLVTCAWLAYEVRGGWPLMFVGTLAWTGAIGLDKSRIRPR